MITEYAALNEENPDPEVIQRAGKIIREGGLVAFPTETVYGLGGDALNPESSKKIYAAKGRPSDNPLIVHICRLSDLDAIVKEVPPQTGKLAELFWPGPLTMIFPKSELVPRETTGGLDTVAVRFPSNRIAQALIDASGGYIAAPSANRSGRPSPTLARYCMEDLDGRVEMVIDGGQVGIGLESTIIDLTEGRPTILRPGFITQKMLEEVLGDVEVDRALIEPDSGKAPKAPGMKYRHYAPKASLTIVEGEAQAVRRKINELAREEQKAGGMVGIIATQETAADYPIGIVKAAGTRTEELTIAMHLYGILREFDELGVSKIYSEAFDTPQMGQAIMNRLIKAAGHQIITA